MSRQVQVIVIILALILVIIGGLYLLKKYLPTPVYTPITKTQSQPQALDKTSSASAFTKPTDLLQVPSSASAQTLTNYMQGITQNAKETNTITFSNCQPDPMIAKVKLGSALTLKNSDSKDIKVLVNSSAQYSVPASSSTTVTPSLAMAVYPVRCLHTGDSSEPTIVGRLYLAQ